MRPTDDVLVCLRRIPLFADLPERTIFDYTIVRCSKGQWIDDGPGGRRMLGVILMGEVEVLSHAAVGGELLLNRLHPLDMFGICNLFVPDSLPTALRCLCDTEVLFINKEEIIRWLTENTEMMKRFLRFYNERIFFLQHTLEILSITTPGERLAAFLLREMDGEGVFRFPQGHERVYSSLGISRASYFRELRRLKEAGLITLGERRMRVMDANALMC